MSGISVELLGGKSECEGVLAGPVVRGAAKRERLSPLIAFSLIAVVSLLLWWGIWSGLSHLL